jgi:hypothetical protein
MSGTIGAHLRHRAGHRGARTAAVAAGLPVALALPLAVALTLAIVTLTVLLVDRVG